MVELEAGVTRASQTVEAMVCVESSIETFSQREPDPPRPSARRRDVADPSTATALPTSASRRAALQSALVDRRSSNRTAVIREKYRPKAILSCPASRLVSCAE